MKHIQPSQLKLHRRAFTLVELLVVISIIGIIAALIIPVAGTIAIHKKINVAQAEMRQIETALEDYKAKYGTYPPSNPTNSPTENSLYYELSGTTISGSPPSYTTLDGNSAITSGDVLSVFDLGGIINSGTANRNATGDDVKVAHDFLPALKATQLSYFSNTVTGNRVYFLVTSVGGPDLQYQPVTGSTGNPFRYVYPGTNNPGSYDLWIQLSINSGFTNSSPNSFSKVSKYLICNWTSQVQRNNPLY
jgi:prepilin-type N-terminal cleavage/methylation domain-containing protein